MKFFYTVILVLLFTSIKLFGQTYSFDVEVKNFTQVDETTFEWEIWLKKADGSSDFALWQMQTRMDFNENILNSGGFVNAYFTITDVGTSMNQNALFFIDDDCTMVGTSPNIQFNWAVSNPPNTGDNMTIISSTWLKVAKFRAQLRKDGNAHNFADADPEFAFQASGTQILVTRANTTAATYDGGGITPVPKNSTTPALGVKVNTRELAGYCFTGTGNWSETARWNNVTTANANTLPTDTKNALIIGSATINSTYTIAQLIVAEDAYLEINSELSSVGYLTVNEGLYNDNPADIGGVGTGTTITLAEWNFEINTNRTADNGTTTNVNSALISNGGELTITDGIVANKGFNNTKGLVGRNFYYWPAESAYSWWQIQLNSTGFQNLVVDVTLTSNNTLGYYKTQWSLNGTEWNDVTNGLLEMPNTSGTYASPIWNSFSDIALPVEIENNSSIYVRFLVFHPTNDEFELIGLSSRNMIDNIRVSGEELPPPPAGLLIVSSAYGTGSLIHNTSSVNSTVQRYIQGTDNYHFISKPITTSITFDDMFPAPDWSNMLVWVREFDEPTASWINKAYYQAPVLGNGYASYITSAPATPVAIFEGALGNGDITKTLTNNGSGWNLLGNPYPSAIDCDLLTKSNLDDATYAWGNEGTYKSWVAGAGTLTNGTVPTGQGFFLHAKTGGGSVTFTNLCRVHDNISYWKSANEWSELLSIGVTTEANTKSDHVFVRFNNEATADFDSQFDAYKLFGDEDAPEIYTSGETIMSINTFGSMTENPSIPLGFKAGVDGTFTFTAEGMESFTNNEPISLQDRVTGIVNDFRVNPVYTFSSDKGTYTDRFILWFGTVGIPENDHFQLHAFTSDEALHIVIPEGQTGTVRVYNIYGQLLVAKDVTHSGLFDIPINDVSSGILVVQFTTPSLTLNCKVLTR